MSKTFIVLMLMLTMTIVLSCGRDEAAEPPVTATTVEQTGTSGPADVAPATAQTWIDDVRIGSELGADGSIVMGKTGDDFELGQPIYLAMDVVDAPANSSVKVIWYGPNETKVGEENKAVAAGPKYLTFTATDAVSWAEGDYRAEVWIGDKKLNTQQFKIVAAPIPPPTEGTP